MHDNIDDEIQKTDERFKKFNLEKDESTPKIRIVTNMIKVVMGAISGLALTLTFYMFFGTFKSVGERVFSSREYYLLLKKFGKFTGLTELFTFGLLYFLFFRPIPIVSLHGTTYVLVFALTILLSVIGVTTLGLRYCCEDYWAPFKR